MSNSLILWLGLGAVLAILNAAIVIGTSIRIIAMAMLKGNAEADDSFLVVVSRDMMFIWLIGANAGLIAFLIDSL